MDWDSLVGLVRDQCHGLHGGEIIYSYRNRTDLKVSGIFRRSHIELDTDGLEISTDQPTVEIDGTDIPGEPTEQDIITITDKGKSTRYSVSDVDTMDSGDLLLYLKII